MFRNLILKSKSLSALNETLNNLTLKDSVTLLKSPIVEADGNFVSIVKADDSINNTNPNISIEEENSKEQEKIEKKKALKDLLIDKIKQTLDVSDEVQAILNNIDKLNKETYDKEWIVNKEDNTAEFAAKNMKIFKQNEKLCLSHNGKIELFNSVEELHDWLNKNNIPLPKGIAIHESINTKLIERKDYTNKPKLDFNALGAWIPILNANISDDDYPTISAEEVEKLKNDEEKKRIGNIYTRKPMNKGETNKYLDRNPDEDPTKELKAFKSITIPKKECTTTAGLGAPVQYTANRKLNEESPYDQTKANEFKFQQLGDNNFNFLFKVLNNLSKNDKSLFIDLIDRCDFNDLDLAKKIEKLEDTLETTTNLNTQENTRLELITLIRNNPTAATEISKKIQDYYYELNTIEDRKKYFLKLFSTHNDSGKNTIPQKNPLSFLNSVKSGEELRNISYQDTKKFEPKHDSINSEILRAGSKYYWFMVGKALADIDPKLYAEDGPLSEITVNDGDSILDVLKTKIQELNKENPNYNKINAMTSNYAKAYEQNAENGKINLFNAIKAVDDIIKNNTDEEFTATFADKIDENGSIVDQIRKLSDIDIKLPFFKVLLSLTKKTIKPIVNTKTDDALEYDAVTNHILNQLVSLNDKNQILDTIKNDFINQSLYTGIYSQLSQAKNAEERKAIIDSLLKPENKLPDVIKQAILLYAVQNKIPLNKETLLDYANQIGLNTEYSVNKPETTPKLLTIFDATKVIKNSENASKLVKKILANLDKTDSDPDIDKDAFNTKYLNVAKELRDTEGKEVGKAIASYVLRNDEKLDITNKEDWKELLESKKTFKEKMQVLKEALFTEDETPADFSDASTSSSNTSTDTISSDMTASSSDSDSKLDLDTDTNTNTNQLPSFGDINIDAGGFDPDEYGPDVADDDNLEGLPVSNDTYKIIDVLKDTNDKSNIKLKLENIETGNITIKDLSEVDI